MNKVIYVPAYFADVGEVKTVKVPTGEVKKSLFGGVKEVTRKEKQWVKTGVSDCVIDSARLSEDVARQVDLLNTEGYEVVSITPIISGKYNYQCKLTSGGAEHKGFGGYGYGYGFSYTDSLMIIAKKCIENS